MGFTKGAVESVLSSVVIGGIVELLILFFGIPSGFIPHPKEEKMKRQSKIANIFFIIYLELGKLSSILPTALMALFAVFFTFFLIDLFLPALEIAAAVPIAITAPMP